MFRKIFAPAPVDESFKFSSSFHYILRSKKLLSLAGLLLFGCATHAVNQSEVESIDPRAEELLREQVPDLAFIVAVDATGKEVLLKSNKLQGVILREDVSIPASTLTRISSETVISYTVNPPCLLRTIGGVKMLIAGDPNECLNQ